LTIRIVWSRSLAQAIGLIGFSVIVSGCFQTAGAQVQATNTPPGGVAIQPVTGSTLSPVGSPAATTLIAPPTAITLIAAAPTTSATATVAQLVFAQPTGSATDTALPTDTAFPSATLPSATPQTFTPTATATIPTTTPSVTATEPAIITPTVVGTSAIAALQNTIVALQATTNGFSAGVATQTQAAAFAQATGIIETATAGAAQQLTLAATLLGTGAPAQPTQLIQPILTTNPPNGITAITLTPISGTPTAIDAGAVNGAQGTIDGSCRYTVVQGDRLFRIALRFNMSTYQVAYPNRLINPDLIVPGQVIVIPGCNGTVPSAPGTTAGGTANGTGAGGTYMVVDGDTLYGIATRYGVRVMALAQTNGITNISLIYIGQNLTIPAR